MLNYCSYYQLAPATLCQQKEVNCTAELVPLVSIPWIKIQLTFPLFYLSFEQIYFLYEKEFLLELPLRFNKLPDTIMKLPSQHICCRLSLK
jgi:hypothetical protein